MKVLVAHTHYIQPGGEDQVFAAECGLLERNGHEVIRFVRHNKVLEDQSTPSLILHTIWNKQTMQALANAIDQHRPDIVHFHNTFPAMSPAVLRVPGAKGCGVVQTLHNYRTICPKALLLRNGEACEACVGRRFAWPAIVHGCYRDSKAATSVVSAMTAVHWFNTTWTRSVDRYIILSETARKRIEAGGFPANKLRIKPNFLVADPGEGQGEGGYAIFVGRLSEEKGILDLLKAWRETSQALPLRIIGDGPLGDAVREAAAVDQRISWLGHMDSGQVMDQIGQASFLTVPSILPEPFGLSTIESLARGTPVLASTAGAAAEIIAHQQTGFLYDPRSPGEFARQLAACSSNPEHLRSMRPAARQAFLASYTAEHNYPRLLAIYKEAVECAAASRKNQH